MCSGDEAASAGGWAVRSQEGSVVQARGGQVPARRQAGLGDAWAGGPGGNLGDLRVRCCSRVAASFGGRFSKRHKNKPELLGGCRRWGRARGVPTPGLGV